MLYDFTVRSSLIFGEEKLDRLSKKRVAVFGIGGVGSYAAEALARGGVGSLELVDSDTVALSNINRQLIALRSTLGLPKAEVMKRRVADINPLASVSVKNALFLPETADEFDFSTYDYVVDAIDTVSGKIALCEKAHEYSVPIISAMGAGNKLDPTAFRVTDIFDTRVCPLARVMRRELKKRGIESLKVVYSEEAPLNAVASDSNESRHAPGSVSFVPGVVGLIIAGEVIKDLMGNTGEPARVSPPNQRFLNNK